MPIRERIGLESDDNRIIGGVPVLHYLDLQSQGRGQVIRLFFIDAGVAFVDVRYPEEEFARDAQGDILQMNPLAKVPIVELNGRVLVQSYAILRYFARVLNKYDGSGDDEKYWVDAMADIGADWRTRFVDALLSSEADVALSHYRRTIRVDFLRAIEHHLKSNPFSRSGSFVLSGKITYADFVLYQVCHDEGLTSFLDQALQDCPRIRQLVEAVEARRNVANYMKSTEYSG